MESLREQLKNAQGLEQIKNPAQKFYKWESEKKCFSYYESETKTNILVDLPLSFVTLGRPLFCVKGYNEKLKKGIYSNEVRTVKDILTVKYFDKNLPIIASGTWEEVKTPADAVDGKYHLSIYGYDLVNKEIINLSVKGNGIGEWSELYKRNSQRMSDEIVIVKEFKEGKKGSVNYTYPSFNLERVITDAELEEVFNALGVLNKYLDKYLKAPVILEVVAEQPQTENAPENIGAENEPDGIEF
jgi:hypothetical protein